MLVEFCYKFISVFFIYVTTSSWLLHVLQLSELYCVRSINMVISRKLSLSTSLSWHRPDTDTTRGRWWASLAREIDREHVLETSNFWLEFNWHYCTELTAFVWSSHEKMLFGSDFLTDLCCLVVEITCTWPSCACCTVMREREQFLPHQIFSVCMSMSIHIWGRSWSWQEFRSIQIYII